MWSRLLGALARPEDRDALLGDLEEEHAVRARTAGAAGAGRWYRRQVMRSIGPCLIARTTPSNEDQGMLHRLWDAGTRDVSQSVRVLRRSPGFSAVALLTLGLGIGAATSIFTVVDGVLLRPLPFAEPDRLYRIGQDGDQGSYWVSAPNFEDMRRSLASFSALAAYTPDGVNVVVEGEPERIDMAEVDAGFFEVLGVEPILGRTFTVEEQRARAPLAVVSHGVWQRRLGGDSDALGRTLVLDGTAREIIGVLPPIPMIPQGAEVWTPLELTSPDWRTSRGIVWLQVVGRLSPDADPEATRAESAALSQTLRESFADVNGELEIGLQTLEDSLVGGVRTELRVLMGAVLLVLLVTALNVGGLFLARASSRRDEVAVRTALGCSRPRLAARFLIESAVLAAIGCALGVVLARAGVAALLALAPLTTPRLGEVSMHGGALLFALAATAATALMAGSLPALQSLRRPVEGLRGGGRSTTGGSRLRGALVVTQVALALALLTGAGLLGKSFWRLRQVDPGFDAASILVAGLPVVESRFPSGAERARHFEELLAAASALPGVRVASLTNSPPFVNSGPFFSYELPDLPARSEAPLIARFRVVSPTIFETLRIPILQGRTFLPEETRAGGERVALVSRELADAHFPGRDPLGQRIYISGDTSRIVGVVGSIRDLTLRAPSPSPHVYLPVSPVTRQGMVLLLRVDGDPAALLEPLRRLVREIDPSQPVTPARPLAAFLTDSVARPRFTLWLLSFFAGSTVLLSALGLYGLLSSFVGGRTREIGVRVALGAATPGIRRMVVARGMKLAALGLLAGSALALWTGTLVDSLLFEVPPRDPLVMAAVAVGLLLTAAAASWIPARRATRIPPSEALRAD